MEDCFFIKLTKICKKNPGNLALVPLWVLLGLVYGIQSLISKFNIFKFLGLFAGISLMLDGLSGFLNMTSLLLSFLG